MKKLMIAAAMSQAAVASWSLNGQAKLGTTVQEGAAIQLFLVNYDGAGNDLLIDSRETTAGKTPAALNGKLSSGNGPMQESFNFGQNTYNDVLFTITDASTVYAVITSMDGKYTQTTEAQALTGLSATQLSTPQFTIGTTIGESGTGVWVAAVPEPTSGLLMLLGMAGLALKRRRA